MPKIIDGLKATILACAKRMLLDKGYHNFTIRAVAHDCSIAVGTIYNYFPNKLMLIASIMADDWKADLGNIHADIAAACDLEAGLYAIYDGIQRFCRTYEPVWDQFVPSTCEFGGVKNRHLLLRSQISEQITYLLEKFAFSDECAFTDLFAECVLSCALQKNISFDSLFQMCSRLFENKK